MKIVESPLIGKVYDFQDLRRVLEGLGFSMSETFTYNYGVFDYALHLSKLEYNYYLRIFVDSVKGYIEKPGCEVKINNIEVLTAKYHSGFYRNLEVPAQYVKQAEELLKKVHNGLKVEGSFSIVDAK